MSRKSWIIVASVAVVCMLAFSYVKVISTPTSIPDPNPPLTPDTAAATPKKVGVLLISYGEPGEYDADAYLGWKNFLLNYMESGMRMMKMSLIYPLLRDRLIPMMDDGTLLVDKDDPLAQEPKENPYLIDAWGNPYLGEDYRWISLPEGEFPMLGPLFSHYLAPGGPGVDEADYWEYLGLSMYGLYQHMDNYDPCEERQLRIMDEAGEKLRERYGDKILISRGFGGARPGFPDFREAAEELVKQGITDLVLAEAYVCQSDFEHPAGEVQRHLEKKGININVIIAGQIGGTKPFSLGVASKVSEELDDLPQDSDVVVFLSHHGMFSLNTLLYNWRKEPYHYHARLAFDGAKEAIYDLDIAKDWQGKFEVWQVYAEFAEGMMDSKSQILSVEEAAKLASEQGYEYCIDIPYGVGNSGYETLIGLRECWGVEPPSWEEYYESGLKKYRSTTEYDGMKVVITDGWIDGSSDGYYEQISKAIDSILE